MAGNRNGNMGLDRSPPLIVNVFFADMDEDTRNEMARILSLLRRYYRDNGDCPIPFYHFVTDPDSFSRTMTNMYHVSFLLRYGLAGVVQHHNMPAILPLDANAGPSVRPRRGTTLGMDIPLWRAIVESLGITRPMIPPPRGQEYNGNLRVDLCEAVLVNEALDNLDEDTRIQMARIRFLLCHYFEQNGHSPIPFYSFTMDPNSYVCTLRNMHHVSLLIRYGLAGAVRLNNTLAILPRNPNADPDAEPGTRVPLVMSVPLWRTIVGLLGITHPMIPPPWS